ncbi:MAG: flagellar filament outer layer protein FlaA, partial [Salinispira sp.]
NKEKEYFLGSLEFDGWRQLTWQNPAYIEDVRNRELSKTPLYPFLTPYAKLVGFRIYRDETHVGGDFITYIKDVDIIYDQALLETQRDIDDETIWGIIETRGDVRTTAQNYRLGERLRLESQEREKQDVAQQDIAQQDAAVQQDAAQQDAAQQDTTQQ